MRLGVVAAVLAIVAVGVIAPALAQGPGAIPPPPPPPPPGPLAASALAQGEVQSLPPVFLKYPAFEAVTVGGSGTYSLTLSDSDFYVIDEGSESVSVSCTVAGETAEISRQAHTWALGVGRYDVWCEATDGSGEQSSVIASFKVNGISGLFPPGDYEERFDRIMSAYEVLGPEELAMVVVYFHRAGILNFDINPNDGVYDPAPDNAFCVPGGHGIGFLASLPGLTTEQKKHCLEIIAESGGFSHVFVPGVF